MIKLKTFLFCLILSVSTLRADENGQIVVSSYNCNSSVFSALDFICNNDLLGAASCKVTQNKCGTGSQEMFSGLNIELASPQKFVNWTGFGGLGELYQNAGICLLRDIKETPITSEAKAPMALGDVSVKQKIQFKSFDPVKKSVELYQTTKACAPVIGCIDILTQKYTFQARSKDYKGQNQKVGDYDIYSGHSIEVESEAIAQAVNVELPALKVVTPYGAIDAKPEFGFGRLFGFNLSPFMGISQTKVSNPMGNANTWDIFGREPGKLASQKFPYHLVLGSRTVDNRHIGWRSQISIGGRDANPKNSFWTPTAGEEFPVRPDEDTNKARSNIEKLPNAYLGANVKVTYNPVGMLPEWVRNSGFISIQFEVFAKPTIDVTFANQFSLLNSEFSKWDMKQLGDYRPNHLDQYKELKVFAGTSAASRFALESGVDLKIHLHVDLGPWLPSIDKDLINIHPRATLAEKINSGHDQSKQTISINSQASKVLATKKFFQSYKTLAGEKVGLSHIASCLKLPAQEDPLPKDPEYTPGNAEELIEEILYPCNICVGMNEESWVDPQTNKKEVIKGFLSILFPSHINNRPNNVKWTCDQIYESGCYDMCRFDAATGNLTVVKTAVEMLATGELSGVRRCK